MSTPTTPKPAAAPCQLVIFVRCEGHDAELPADWATGVQVVDGPGTAIYRSSTTAESRLLLSHPGRYRLTIPDLPGLGSVPDQVVHIETRGVNQLVVELQSS